MNSCLVKGSYRFSMILVLQEVELVRSDFYIHEISPEADCVAHPKLVSDHKEV